MPEAGLLGVLTLAVGFAVGFVSERYGVYFVSPVREAILLPKKVLSELRYSLQEFLDSGSYAPTILGSLTAFLLINAVGVRTPPDYTLTISRTLLLLSGAGVLGYFSAKADGCPLKMHVRVGRGESEAFAYIAGFYLGIIYFYLFLEEIILTLTTLFP